MSRSGKPKGSGKHGVYVKVPMEDRIAFRHGDESEVMDKLDEPYSHAELPSPQDSGRQTLQARSLDILRKGGWT